jgi:hypothetical protein
VVRRLAPLVPALVFRAAEAVFDRAAERALVGGVIDLVAALERPVALGCARLLAVDEAFDPLRDRVADFSAAFRLVRDGVF